MSRIKGKPIARTKARTTGRTRSRPTDVRLEGATLREYAPGWVVIWTDAEAGTSKSSAPGEPHDFANLN